MLHPEVVKLCKALKKLNSNDLRYIVLAYDYNSKYRQFPLEERRRKAEREVYGSKAVDIEANRTDIKSAVEEYNALQYDVDRELENICIAKIHDLQKQLVSVDVTATGGEQKMTKILKAIESLEKQRDTARDKYQATLDSIILKGGGEPSFLEIFMKNERDRRLKRDREITDGL